MEETKPTQSSNVKNIVAIIIAIVVVALIIKFFPKSDVVPTTVPDTSTTPVASKETLPTDTTSVPVVTDTKPASVPTTPVKPSTSTTKPVTATIPPKPTSPYKNGTYTAEGGYQAPSGFESINVSLTLKDGIVVDSTVLAEAQGGKSQRYQEVFISGYKQYVTGKSIDSLNLSNVSGSSLTPNGFNSAVEKIKTEAKA